MSLFERIAARTAGLALYGLAPPKLATVRERIDAIAARQVERLRRLRPDGVIVYDLQDEPGRTGEPRPFPFLPTVDPLAWADALAGAGVPAIVYRSVGRDDASSFTQWLAQLGPRGAVLVGNPTAKAASGLALHEAYALCRATTPDLALGGIAIAERHARRLDEHERIMQKIAAGCRFFVTQAVYDVTATKSLVSDVHFALREQGIDPVPLVLTFSPCASMQTLRFMQWLGIAFPRWLENELRFATDPLRTSVELCLSIFDEAWAFARDKGVPLGVNVESVSIRKAEIEASELLFTELRARMTT